MQAFKPNTVVEVEALASRANGAPRFLTILTESGKLGPRLSFPPVEPDLRWYPFKVQQNPKGRIRRRSAFLIKLV